MHPHPLAIEVIGGGGILDEDAFPLEKREILAGTMDDLIHNDGFP